MTVSKRKVGNRLVYCLLACLTLYLITMFFVFDRVDTRHQLDGYQKTSVDNTPIFNLTEPHTNCQYVYDSVNKTIIQAKGSETCPLPNFN